MYAGVPLICIPSVGDQIYNAAIVEQLGIGIYVRRYLMDGSAYVFEEDLENALNEIFDEK
ncbi:unnamed protein product [Meloidogyne enterolobii]|uniref:Uncharacterized protein n=2 Tax=Meloidogyne enterolobii TaxID=390850 RepID=A0ACB1AA68_MELEN